MPGAYDRWLDLSSRGAQMLARFVFPETCAGCGAAGAWMCELCERELIDLAAGPVLGSDRSISTDETHSGGGLHVELHARFAFQGPARKAVHLLKYQGERARAEWFADMILSILPASDRGEMLLVPIPLTERRRRKRGFNQSADIAEHVGRRAGIHVAHAATRIRETRPQVELGGIERLHNVRGAFRADKVVRGRHVLLVDDVVTTGATMRECGRACYEAGAVRVTGLAGASGIGRT